MPFHIVCTFTRQTQKLTQCKFHRDMDFWNRYRTMVCEYIMSAYWTPSTCLHADQQMEVSYCLASPSLWGTAAISFQSDFMSEKGVSFCSCMSSYIFPSMDLFIIRSHAAYLHQGDNGISHNFGCVFCCCATQ